MTVGTNDRPIPTDSSMLVRGETGSGKELVAQAIHRQSPRRSHLLVKVDYAALPSGLDRPTLYSRMKKLDIRSPGGRRRGPKRDS